MSYLQVKHPKHFHRYFVDSDSNDAVCLCGKVKGKKVKDLPKNSPNKYHNRTTIYNGYNYDSKKEAEYAMFLDDEKRRGMIKEWERQYPIEVRINGQKIFRMKVDFLIHLNDGSKELREIKGYETDIFRLKKKLIDAVFLKENPEYTYLLIK